MEIPTGLFFAITWGSYIIGAVGTLLVAWSFIFGKKASADKPSSGGTYTEKKTPEQRIAEAKPFDELERVVYDIGPIQGSSQTYYPPEMAARLKALDAYVTGKTFVSPPKDPYRRKAWLEQYHGTEDDARRMELVANYVSKLEQDPDLKRWPTNLITSTYGLREKVEEILNNQESNLHELKKK